MGPSFMLTIELQMVNNFLARKTAPFKTHVFKVYVLESTPSYILLT